MWRYINMEITIQRVRGFFQPRSYINKITAQEHVSVKPLIGRVSFLLLLSILVSILYSFFGYRSEGIAIIISQHSEGHIESLQFLHAVGIVLKGIFYPLFYLFLSTLAAYLFFKDSSVKILLVVHHYFIAFIVLHQLVHAILFYLFGIPTISSPFSLGILAQVMTENQFLINFSSYINLFYIGGTVLLIALMNQHSSRKLTHTSLYIAGIHLLIALIGAGVSMIKVDALLL
jgi:hypothetical protein